MNLEASLQQLFQRNLHVIKLDLEPMKELLDILGNPHESFITIHVAGTNGKGSVCAMLDAILQAQGYRTGLYTSPHLVSFNERIKVSGEDISDEHLEVLIDEVETAVVKLRGRGIRDVTFYEFTTALAFLHFKNAGVQIAVIETGMGGRLDATNVLIPAVSVITSIGFDHQKHLGNTIEAIAGEKAGIIKQGRPVVIGRLSDEAMAVMRERSQRVNAPLRMTEEATTVTVKNMSLSGQSLQASSQTADYGTIHTRMNGMHQAGNAAIAIAVAECLDQEVGIDVTADAIKAGIASARWPARCELVSDQPPTIVDGGHNPDAARVLAQWVSRVSEGRPLGMIVGFVADKEPEQFMQAFRGIAEKVWLVPLQSDRAMPVDELAARLSGLKHTVRCASLDDAKTQAIAWGNEAHGIVLVTGSLYLAGEFLAS